MGTRVLLRTPLARLPRHPRPQAPVPLAVWVHTHSRPPVRGLYGLPHLQTPDCFEDHAGRTVKRCTELRERLNTLQNPSEVLATVDEISQEVCSVTDPAELCLNTHQDAAFRSAAQKACEQVSHFIYQLNADVGIYRKLKQCAASAAPLHAEEQCALHQHIQEFELNGIHLSLGKRKRIFELHSRLFNICGLFKHNLQAALASAPAVDGLLATTADREKRRTLYMMGQTLAPENIQVLEDIVDTRHELAQILSFKTYADYALHKIGKSPAQMEDFLLHASRAIQPLEAAELAQLVQHLPTGSGEVQRWDLPFVMERARQRHEQAQPGLREYLSIPGLVRGAQQLFHTLFGIRLERVSPVPGECWADDVVKLNVLSEGGLAGVLYLDLSQREGKTTDNATFSIALPTCSPTTSDLVSLPRLAVVCSFGNSRRLTGLSLSEVEVFFHELGHAAHILLSRTLFQHVAGTRGHIDMVEIPSTLFEQFVWDHDFMSTIATNPRTGKPVPRDLLEHAHRGRAQFRGIAMQEQVGLSLFDLHLHQQRHRVAPHSADTPPIAMLHAAACQSRLAPVPGSLYPAQFSHVLTYGACYWTYLYSRACSLLLHGALFPPHAAAPSRVAGAVVAERMLRHGGMRTSQDVVQAVLGHTPTAAELVAALAHERQSIQPN